MNTTTIIVKNGAPGTLSNADGVSLKIAIEKALSDDNIAILSFAGIDTISTSFLNSSIGEIVDQFGIQTLKNRIKISHYTPSLAAVISKYVGELTASVH